MDNGAFTQLVPVRRTVNRLPNELLEMILCEFGEDDEQMLRVRVCHRWWCIIMDFRRRKKMTLQFYTPIAVGLRSMPLAIWSYGHGLPLTVRTMEIGRAHV